MDPNGNNIDLSNNNRDFNANGPYDFNNGYEAAAAVGKLGNDVPYSD